MAGGTLLSFLPLGAAAWEEVLGNYSDCKGKIKSRGRERVSVRKREKK